MGATLLFRPFLERGAGMNRNLLGYGGAWPDITWRSGARLAVSVVVNFEEGAECPSSNKMGHQTGLSFGGSGSYVGLIMQPAFDVASGDIGLSVS